LKKRSKERKRTQTLHVLRRCPH